MMKYFGKRATGIHRAVLFKEKTMCFGGRVTGQGRAQGT